MRNRNLSKKMQQSNLAPWKVLKPFARLFEAYGKRIENVGKTMIKEDHKPFLPQNFGIVLHEKESELALNYEPLNKIGCTQPKLSEGDKTLEKLMPTKFKDTLYDQLFVAQNSVIGSTVHISPFCTIWYGARLGDNVSISQRSHILDNAKIGKNSRIGENVVIMPGASIGENVIIHDNCLIEAGMHVPNDSIIGKDTHISSIIQNSSNQKEISAQEPIEGLSRREELIKVITEAGLGEHKRECERTISEILELRFDLALQLCELEDVIKPGTWQAQQEANRIEASRDKYTLYKEEESVFLTDAKVENTTTST